ncbi:hypothetical protein [Lactobacillus hominis]|uniref:Bacteriocin n=1 Tax=Lactobacillus hominis DSM 23910 = CRBIP 24.179 TaxID=1423758 RepID=I7L7C9_9LACO|nr:hypothetical protein [Lactobacillus hominis]KRM85195.1 hypothetical protein FC41_GL001576 [Lactobacillus hominis DSM 23910 = CRBIP 24.179]MCT3348360.1 hypothetical protein [Lactobacillus hominis]CCI82557.1 Protein of unknown function [Lactobacillus hominis DSM 23910 = CRBIP 24.179]
MKRKLLLVATATLVGCSLAVFSLKNDHSTVQAVTTKTQGGWWLNWTKQMGGSNIPGPNWGSINKGRVFGKGAPYTFRGVGHP